MIVMCVNRNRPMQKDKMYAVWITPLLLIIAMCPTWAARPEVVYAQVGASVRLPTKDKAGEGVYMTWFFGSDENNIKHPVFNKHGLGSININDTWKARVSVPDSDYSLIINKVQDSDFGYFKYEQTGKPDMQSRIEKVYRLRRVTLKVDPPSAALHGDSLTLTCQVEPESQVSTTITWFPPETVDSTRRMSVSRTHKATLTIMNVSWHDKGVWTCSLQYNGHKTNATTTVHVVDLSPPPSEPIYTSDSASSPLHLPCSISSPVEWEVVLKKGLQKGTWSFLPASDSSKPHHLASLSLNSTPSWDFSVGKGMEGSALKNKPQGNDLSLSKKGVTARDRGNYTCALRFKSNLNLMRIMTVEVLQVLAYPNARVFEGQWLNLTCTLGHTLAPELQVKWVPPKAVSLAILGSSPHPHTLILAKTSVSHSGKWKCELYREDKVLTFVEVSLKIERVPVDVWLWVGIASTVLIVILLIFIGRALIKRHRQQRTAHRRKTRFCCCKDPKPQKGFYRT